MKKILIALAILGMTYCGAEAQTKSTDSKTNMTCTKTVKAKKVVHKHRRPVRHQVCTNKGGYYTCCEEKSTAAKK
jgi:hypothetical protein